MTLNPIYFSLNYFSLNYYQSLHVTMFESTKLDIMYACEKEASSLLTSLPVVNFGMLTVLCLVRPCTGCYEISRGWP